MAITTSNPAGSSYTAQVSTTGTNNTIDALITGVKAAVIGTTAAGPTGWTCEFDTAVTSRYRVQGYKALNKDGITYKWLIARWDYDKMELNTSTCDSAVSATDITNESHSFFDCSPVGFSTQACDIIVMVNPRWLAFTSFINNEQSLWSGVFETLRENPNDTAAAGYPCWAWVSSTLPMLGMGQYNSSNGTLASSAATFCAFSRTRTDSTGLAAAKNFAVACDIITHPSWADSTSVPPLVAFLGNMSNGGKFSNTAWSLNKLVLPIKPQHNYNSAAPTTYGTMCGLKMLGPSTSQGMNQIAVITDVDGNYSAGGSPNNHWLLNTSFKAISVVSTEWCTSNALWTPADVSLGTGYPATDIAATGAKYYCSSPNGLYVVDAVSTVATAVAGASACDGMVKYDGERYVYATTAAGLLRLDVTDNSVISLALLTGGVQGIAISGTKVLCTPRTASTTPVCALVTRGVSFTGSEVTALTAMSPAFGESVVLGTLFASSSNDVFYAVPSYIATGSNGKLIRITSDGAVSYPLAAGEVSGSYAYSVSGMYAVDRSTGIIVTQTVGSNGTARRMYFSLSDGTVLFTVTGSSMAGSHANSTLPAYMTKVCGVVVGFPRIANASKTIWVQSLGEHLVSAYPASSIGGGTLLAGGASTIAGSSALYNGAVLIHGTAAGIRIFSGVNGMYAGSTTSTAPGRFCLPS